MIAARRARLPLRSQRRLRARAAARADPPRPVRSARPALRAGLRPALRRRVALRHRARLRARGRACSTSWSSGGSRAGWARSRTSASTSSPEASASPWRRSSSSAIGSRCGSAAPAGRPPCAPPRQRAAPRRVHRPGPPRPRLRGDQHRRAGPLPVPRGPAARAVGALASPAGAGRAPSRRLAEGEDFFVAEARFHLEARNRLREARTARARRRPSRRCSSATSARSWPPLPRPRLPPGEAERLRRAGPDGGRSGP